MTPDPSPSTARQPTPRAATVDNRSATRRPVALVVVCALVVLQAGLLIGLATAWASGVVRGASTLPAAMVFLVLFCVGVAAVLVLAARGLWNGRRWARSPVMTWEILLVVMAVGWVGADPTVWAAAVLASALLVGVGLLTPAVVAAAVDRRDA